LRGVRRVVVIGGAALAAALSGWAGISASAKTVALSSFRTPSGNVGCQMGTGYVRCDIRKHSWKAPSKPKSCQLDFGQGVEVTRTGKGHFVCAGDTALDPHAPVLAYGNDSHSGGIRCQSRRAGVTCTADKSHHGFFLSAGSYKLF
jgi:hypothetical protein